MTKLSREQIKELKEVFQTADTNDAGLLDGEALYNALRALGLEVPVTETGIRDLLIRVGRQDEGYVDFDDFKKMVAELMTDDHESIQRDRCDFVFRSLMMGENGSGITIETLRRAAAAQGETWTNQELDEMFNEADINHDGIVDPAEFKRVWKMAGF
ncbi:hypothetical protein VTP01DRAFT_1165 [Rhizomucor pusillus]|uniref:uncharacterized protein n=1 Tax=Rhizomucor pusillus TaxID=4840 RepID=UPI0037435D88